MPFEENANRVWRSLPAEDRGRAATAFWAGPGEEAGTALVVIAQARRMRPQVARRLDEEAKARILATVLEPGEPLAFALLVAFHLEHRREVLVAFLDAVGLPHEDGILTDEADSAPLTENAARAGIEALAARFEASHIECYLNTLWLQDPARWAPVERAYDAWESTGATMAPSSDCASRDGSSSQ